MATTENGTSRQRSLRVPIPVDDWLLQRAKETRSNDDDSRAGIATEANAILLAAFKADPKNKGKLHLVADL